MKVDTVRTCVGLFQPRREVLDRYDIVSPFFNWRPSLKAAERHSGDCHAPQPLSRL